MYARYRLRKRSPLLERFAENTFAQAAPERSTLKTEGSAYQWSDPVDERLMPIFFIRSGLCLVVDLQDCSPVPGKYWSPSRNRFIYRQFCKAKDKGQFHKEHSAEITFYETARRFLQKQSVDGKLPSMKLLKEERATLLRKRKGAQDTYRYYQNHKKELDTVRSNVDMILNRTQNR